MGWPTSTNLEDYLQAAGLIDLTPTTAQGLLDLAGALAAAIERWDDLTGYWPFMSTGVDQKRIYTAFPLRDVLDLDNGLLSLSAMIIDVTYTNSEGTQKTHLQHFKLMPRNAPELGKPYTYIEWLWPMQTVSDSEIEITGKWGYCLEANLPDSAKRGVLALAALELMPQLQSWIRRRICGVNWQTAPSSSTAASG
jgi:hypothetical protein